MSLLILEKVLHNTSVKGHEKLVLLCLANFSNDQGLIWLSIANMARWTGVSKSTVVKILKNLRARKLIKKIPGKRYLQVSVYKISQRGISL